MYICREREREPCTERYVVHTRDIYIAQTGGARL